MCACHRLSPQGGGGGGGRGYGWSCLGGSFSEKIKCVKRRPLTSTGIAVPAELSSCALWHMDVMACQLPPTSHPAPDAASVDFCVYPPPSSQQTLSRPWNAACLPSEYSCAFEHFHRITPHTHQFLLQQFSWTVLCFNKSPLVLISKAQCRAGYFWHIYGNK